MAKSKLGKFIAFTTAVAAIGGTCYVFRDKIKQSEIYNKIVNSLADRMNGDDDFDTDFDDDFDDTDIFSENAKNDREYTSIQITSNTDASQADTPLDDIPQDDTTKDDTPDMKDTAPSEEDKKDADIVVNPSLSVSSYEYEGLSDVSEDPDTLEEQDKLDF